MRNDCSHSPTPSAAVRRSAPTGNRSGDAPRRGHGRRFLPGVNAGASSPESGELRYLTRDNGPLLAHAYPRGRSRRFVPSTRPPASRPDAWTGRVTQSIICTKIAIAIPCSSGQSSPLMGIRPPHTTLTSTSGTLEPGEHRIARTSTEQARRPVRSGTGPALRGHEEGITTEPHHRFRFILVARRDLP